MHKKGQNVGYIRVSTAEQNTARQLDGIALDRVFTDTASGKDTDRPALQQCLEYVRDGDTLHVHSLDRLARNLLDLRAMVKDLADKGVTVHFHTEHLITGNESPVGTLMLNMMGAFAEFERAVLLERQREGITQARARGAYTGRNRSLTPEQAAELRRRVADGEHKTVLARELRISRATVYAYLAPETR